MEFGDESNFMDDTRLRQLSNQGRFDIHLHDGPPAFSLQIFILDYHLIQRPSMGRIDARYEAS